MSRHSKSRAATLNTWIWTEAVKRGGPRHAHSEGKTGSRHGTHEKLQTGFKAFLGTRALAQLAGPRLSSRETQNFTQKLHFCTIKLFQINSHKPKTTTNISNKLKPLRNTNLISQNTTKSQEHNIPKSNLNFKLKRKTWSSRNLRTRIT